MQIVIGTAGLAFHGHSLLEGSLGGSETAVICMARAFAKLGHDVRVYCECKRPGTYDGVQYTHHKHFKTHSINLDIDVLIASRWPDFLATKAKAALRVLWCHDLLHSKEQLMSGLYQTDFLFLLSDFHIEDYCKQLPHLRPFCNKTSNGVDLELIEANKKPKVPKKLIYTSRPERGLTNLLRLMPRILERHPDAKLYCCTYKNDLIKENDPAAILCQQADAMAKKMPNNVVQMGNLTKAQLYSHVSSSQLQLYPTDFGEIFCIASSESQACGTPFISTNNFALSETCGPGSSVLIDGLPGQKDYDDKFVNAVCELLDDADTRQRMSEAGPEWIKEQGYVWDDVAKNWETKFRLRMQQRWLDSGDKILTELYRQSDIMPAAWLADEINDKEAIEQLADAHHAVLYRAVDPEDSAKEFRDSIPLFQEMTELLGKNGCMPKTVLDCQAGYAGFGLFLAKQCPEVAVTLWPKRGVEPELVNAMVQRAGLTNVRVKIADDEKFDLVVCSDYLDRVEDPAFAVNEIIPLLLDSGVAVFTTRSGAVAGTVKRANPDRLWNLSVADFTQMFSDCDADFKASFFSQGIGEAGDLLGRWIGMFRKPTQGEVQPITAERRKTNTRPYQKLAVCMITKNEQAWLASSLDSTKTIADQVIIADSESTDRTLSIACDHEVEVRAIHFDNFSQARNESIEGVDADWILWIDADERLVGADNVRRYLESAIYEGFAIRQNHLMLDQPKAFDLPVRIFKNRPHYRFTGLIHEQCEDVSKNPFDDQITPVLTLPDVDIAHFGYINERQRKQKCSNRNMNLLIRDVQESKGRMLTAVLVMRDYLNIVKWYGNLGYEITRGSFMHKCLEATIATYHYHFANSSHRFAGLSESSYQEALQLLGTYGLPFGDMARPPFEAGITLLAAWGGIDDPNVAPKLRWFLCAEELKLFIASKSADLTTQMFGPDGSTPEQFKLDCPLPDPVPLLTQGCDLFAQR